MTGIEWVVAFVITFSAGDIGNGNRIETHDHALRICKMEFPKERIKRSLPVVITLVLGNSYVTPFVYVCERPVKVT